MSVSDMIATIIFFWEWTDHCISQGVWDKNQIVSRKYFFMFNKTITLFWGNVGLKKSKFRVWVGLVFFVLFDMF